MAVKMFVAVSARMIAARLVQLVADRYAHQPAALAV
jgi:hypothetical protein